MKGTSMTSISTRKTAKMLLLAAVVAAMATAQLNSAGANAATRTYPTSTYPIHYPVYQRNPYRPYFGMRPFANVTPRKTFVAGGATLPAVAYEGSTATINNPSLPVAGSVFGYFQSVLSTDNTVIQYCQTGSGFGKKVYDGLPGATAGVNGPCAALGVKPGATNGFGAPAALGLTDPDITGSDSPLSQAEYSQFVSAKASTRGEPTELPEIAGAVSLFYNNPDTGTTQIHLTDANICGMVLGTITNWSSLGFPSRPLSFVYRSDGSGTTFSFANHIQAVCHNTLISTNQQFTGTPGNDVIDTAPTGSVGASGNPGVVSQIVSVAGSIGYAEAANALSSRNASKGINFALVNGFDPIKNLPEAAAKLNGVTSVVKDSIVVTAAGKGATTAAISPAPVHAGCVLLVKPSAYANLSGGYPILGVSYHLYSYSGNGATGTPSNTTKLRTLAQELTKSGIKYNNQAGTKNITTVDAATSTVGTGTTGFSTLGTSFQTPVKTASNSCING
jgi:phosphate transport system substrate-binding protein